MADILAFVEKCLAQFHSLTALIATFFGGLADLATAPALAAGGLDAVVSAGEMAGASVMNLIGSAE